ncbi:MAG: helix-turn-helix domain-containing protein [Anaerolineae bacterium]|nr:helix-turn-helix domain-containing protein [Anaerolineae bacterium]
MSEQSYNPLSDEWLTTKEGARLIGISSGYLRLAAKKGLIFAHKVGRDWLVSRTSLLEYKREMDALGNAKHNGWRGRRRDGGDNGQES